MTTNPGGRMLISYRRQRAAEVMLLEQALHDRGIPTWLDTADLPFGHTPTELDVALGDPDTAGAVLFLTPEVAESPYIMDLEIPGAFKRAMGPQFILIPVAAGGLDYDSAAEMVRGRTGVHELSHWNVVHIHSTTMSASAARSVARRALNQRVSSVASDAKRISIALSTRTPLAFEPHRIGLRIDHRRFFNGRVAKAESIEELKEAINDVKEAIAARAPTLEVQLEGQVTIAYAIRLGLAFSSTSGLSASWLQRRVGAEIEAWKLKTKPIARLTPIEVLRGEPGSNNIAIVVSVADNAEPAFGRAKQELDPYGMIVLARAQALAPLSPDSASNLAFDIVDALREAREKMGRDGSVHFFGAVPVGLAFLIGQLLNTFATVECYEYDAAGYVRSGI